jgi:hypothetical protein
MCRSTSLLSKILAGDWHPHTKPGGAATEQCTSSSNEQKHLCSTETEMETEMDDSCQTGIVTRLMFNSKQQKHTTMMTSKETAKQLRCGATALNTLIQKN